MRLDANPYAESQGLGSPLMRPPYVDGESRPPPPTTAHMPSSTTSPTPTGVVVARACLCLQNGAAVSGTARRDDVPTALRQNPAAKDHFGAGARRPMLWLGRQGRCFLHQRSRSRDQLPRKRYVATLNSSLRQPSISKPPPRAPRRAQQHRRAEVTPNQWPPTASDDEYASPS